MIFHKNITTYYPKEWIDKCYDSIRNQSYRDFDVFELDYGGGSNHTYKGSNFRSVNLGNHADAHNYLIDWIYSEGYDCAFNVNVDDWYALNRFELQIPYVELGYDAISSNFYRVNNDESVKQEFRFHYKSWGFEASKGHNIMAHPVMCYSRKFMELADHLVAEEIPRDDFNLWKKCYAQGELKFIILRDFLLFQRIHDNNISKKGKWKID